MDGLVRIMPKIASQLEWPLTHVTQDTMKLQCNVDNISVSIISKVNCNKVFHLLISNFNKVRVITNKWRKSRGTLIEYTRITSNSGIDVVA